MAESLYELLLPALRRGSQDAASTTLQDEIAGKYLNRLTTLSLQALDTAEDESLSQSSHTNDISLQSLAARSNGTIVASSEHLKSLESALPLLAQQAAALRVEYRQLDRKAVAFSEKYSKNTENAVLDRRKSALLSERNVDRITDMLDLPTLLTSAISTTTTQDAASNAGNYATALDLYSHIKRLHLLYQESDLIGDVYEQAEKAMLDMTSSLLRGLRASNIKLVAAMRTIGWLKRVVPDLGTSGQKDSNETLGALFLVCRLATLISTLSALEPLRDLADQETALQKRHRRDTTQDTNKDAWTQGQQTERYLKRYIEIFREQSFAIISMYRSIFPSAPDPGISATPSNLITHSDRHGAMLHSSVKSIDDDDSNYSPLGPRPSALATFPSHLVNLLFAVLKQYLPNVRDRASYESLMTQVLYCAGSLGRLGGDFSLLLAELGPKICTNDEDDNDSTDDGEDEADGGSTIMKDEWIVIMKKHRILAGKLEKMAAGIEI